MICIIGGVSFAILWGTLGVSFRKNLFPCSFSRNHL